MEPSDLGIDLDLLPILRNLAQRYGFTVEDLLENREGRLSKRQLRWFRRWVLLSVGRFVAIVTIFGFGLWQIVEAKPGASNRVVNWIIGLVVLAFIGAVTWLSARVLMQLIRAMKNGTVASVEGHGATVSRVAAGYKRYYYVIGSRRFAVSARAFEALVPDVYYRAYYTPNGNYLFTVEPLRRRQRRQPAALQGGQPNGATQG